MPLARLWDWLRSTDEAAEVELSAEARAELLLSRRRLLQGGGLLGALGGAATAAAGAPAAGDALRFLVNRLNFGFTLAEYQRAQQLGYTGYLEYQLAHTSIPDPVLEARLAQFPALTLDVHEFYDAFVGMSFTPAMVSQLDQFIFGAGISNRQLFERMVELWNDHFNIFLSESEMAFLRLVDQRNVIRAHALGHFPDMLHASAHSPAMLLYLDNYINTVDTPNENYGREIMELHSLGVDGGYTQEDVVEVARAFTGWGFFPYDIQPRSLAWSFRFLQSAHDFGPKRILGHDFPAGRGYEEGLDVLEILSQHPSTARYIATKICRHFYSYDPPSSLVNSVAQTYLATDGDIKAMIRTLFNSIDPETAPLKLKRPLHMFISGIRATGANFGSAGTLRAELGKARHLPADWGPPDGYPDRLDAWSGMMLPRWNFSFLLANGGISGAFVDVDAFFGGTTSPFMMSLILDEKLYGGAMPFDVHNAIRNYALVDPVARRRDALALALAAPAYQWY